MRRHAVCLGLSIVTGLMAWLPTASAQSEAFYKGKRLTLLINFAAGGPADIEGRLFARHFGKHIDGAPNIIVQNRDGAGGLVGTNYLGELGPRDGTMAGYLTAAAWNYVIDPGSYRVDFSTYEFIAYQPVNVVYYMRADTPPGMKSAADLMRATALVAGGLAADSSKDLLIRLTLDMLGVPYKYVTGFRSSAPARLALQRGEINFFSESSPSYFGVVEPTLVKTGQAIPVWYDPIYDGVTSRASSRWRARACRAFRISTARPRAQRRRAGCGTSTASISRSIPRCCARWCCRRVRPPEAVAALRRATERLNGDAEFAKEAQKALQFVPQYVTSGDLNARVRRTLVVTPRGAELRDRLHQEPAEIARSLRCALEDERQPALHAGAVGVVVGAELGLQPRLVVQHAAVEPDARAASRISANHDRKTIASPTRKMRCPRYIGLRVQRVGAVIEDPVGHGFHAGAAAGARAAIAADQLVLQVAPQHQRRPHQSMRGQPPCQANSKASTASGHRMKVCTGVRLSQRST